MGHAAPLEARRNGAESHHWCSFVSMSVFVHDWLHVMDIWGIVRLPREFVSLLQRHKPGAKQGERMRVLHQDLMAYYNRRRDVTSKLDNLTPSMLGKTGRPPKLRARGAEARGLIDFAKELADAVLNDGNTEQLAAKQAAAHLQACYANLSASTFDHESMKEHSRNLCSLLAALEATTPEDSACWRLKPKVHQMQELCEMSTHNHLSIGATATRTSEEAWQHMQECVAAELPLVRLPSASCPDFAQSTHCLVSTECSQAKTHFN